MINLKTLAQLDLNLLKVLEALYQHKNMTRAAEQLNITPSAVSHSIKRLRDALEDPLFIRQGSKMQPTAVCRRVMPDIIHTLGQLRQALQSLGSFEPSTASHALTFAIHDALEPLFFPIILAAFQQQSPNLIFHSVKLERESLPMQLESGLVDFAIDVARPLSTPIEHERIASSSFCCLGGKQFFPKQQISSADYGQLQHITVSNRPTGKVLEDLAFAKLGFNRTIKARCQRYPTAIQLLKQQKSILTLPHSIALSLLDDELKILNLPFEVPAVDTHLYWHAQNQSDSLHNWLRENLLTELKNII